MKTEEKIKTRMDELQRSMEHNAHLTEKLYMMELYYSVSKFWSVLSEEDRDYLQAANYAITENIEWNVP